MIRNLIMEWVIVSEVKVKVKVKVKE